MGKALTLCLALAGCATTAPIGNPREVWCDHNQPRRPSLAVVQAMSRPELDEMNSFNAQGAMWCGWRPE
ncbi:hypothetical protein [Mesorhizobium sp.]|uniref:hypothetical protein n=1 Tax=Mesorhizobium sp. TaxID=1871066 RepID=UPI000FE3B491|nr:hypothetical protein [Mesorhizobium sp.]RWN51929.1 MAG: hypothetical protein EOR98_24045 [Mesorhizobium sp.]RWN73062.1 MAG: hypothetical protein EOS02_25555 [Mesorhizobium sp.]RWN76244.1 MAG: hypothetical protein EOS01_21270 [Mesorhizobium sp.]RWN85990.1 MAG: hypothetical protein EOS04_20665 [Mesorhizobium sp.]RWO11755.1 MAG: hypothetical protein EOS15_21895 [Mesorhizobium sp.]